MKLKFRIDREALLVVNTALHNGEALILIGEMISRKNIEKSIILELKDIVFKKFFTQSQKPTIELYKHSAVAFYEVLQVILSMNELSPPIFVKIDQLKNEIHQKTLLL